MSRRISVVSGVVESQRRASDPGSFAWVSANAGSGKTHVLTERVLRLLLSGVDPDRILCLTYTKAAAAEMRKRVAGRLAEWTTLDDDALIVKLGQLEGRPPHPAALQRARTLFAYALETPGGLKVMTIHAFCESVLHRFPKEAGVPFDFQVIEDQGREDMLLAIRESVIAAAIAGQGDVAAVEILLASLSDFSIAEVIGEALAQPRALRAVLADVPRAKRRLRELVGVTRGMTPATVLAEITEDYGLDRSDHDAIFAIAPPVAGKTEFIEKLSRIDPDQPQFEALRTTFLTDKDTRRASLLRKAEAQRLPDIAQRVDAEADRIERLVGQLTALELVARSEAVLDIVATIVERYTREKRARSLLDFDDLIVALARLLEDEGKGPWVGYKLDAEITHILVDESQDTNQEQWRVVRALAADFLSGESAARRPRTLFAVGDQKQSIFSFQGAEPILFVDTGRQYAYEAKLAAVGFEQVRLRYSFRTLPNILDAVDRTFARDDLRDAVLEDEPVAHSTVRSEGGGTVTLWPPVQDVDEPDETDEWPLQPPALAKRAARQVAERIVREIGGWIAARRPLGPRRRPVTADDVLILVQTRGVLFQEIIRALARDGVPTPGADRLPVTSHIAVLDLMALGDVLLNPADDLQLAALLRSPLFDVTDDELYQLAQPRAEGETLWTALAACTIPACRDAHDRLGGWRSRLDFERPFNFFTEVLYRDEGLRRFHRRLGPEVDDVLAEFLNLALEHEQASDPSLQAFLAALRANDVTIKRELAESGSGVRVMTVHGAKGLEAPVVILADAATTDRGRFRQSVYVRETDPGPFLFHAGGDVPATKAMKDARKDAATDEYWRLLYVAMTRAEDELYVTGMLTNKGKLDGSWYEAIEQAIGTDTETVTSTDGAVALVYPARPKEETVTATLAQPDAHPAQDLPSLPPYQLPRIIRPSRAGSLVRGAPSADPDAERVLDTAVEALVPRDPDAARREGLALHALLQHLSRFPAERRPALAQGAMPALLPDSPERHEAIARKALSILARPELQSIFGPLSRAELPILAHGTRNGAPITIAGRIDRLVAEPGRVQIVDYKSDSAVPSSTAAVPDSYRSQLGLYALVATKLFPGRSIEASILWTGPERLMNLPLPELLKAVGAITLL